MLMELCRGESEAAQFVWDQRTRNNRFLQKSVAIGLESVIREELADVWEECCEPNWDGYDAFPVLEETYSNAKRFLQSLPPGTPIPSLGAEPDGCVTVEWRPSRRRTLSVSLSADGDLTYAALLGPEETCGAMPFFDEVPPAILRLIGDVTSC